MRRLLSLWDAEGSGCPRISRERGRVRVQKVTCTLMPSVVDPYCEIWEDCRLVRVDKIPPKRYRDQALVFVRELAVREESGWMLRGYTEDIFVARKPSGTSVPISLTLVECYRISSSPLALCRVWTGASHL
jgi:hypothetical protein